jgi:16S rRNA (cytosine1402-N4)-methyltransferase
MTKGFEEEEDAWHVPVMVNEVRDFLISDSTKVIVDCSVGTGGHAAAMLAAAPSDCVLYGFDLDDEALHHAKLRLSEFEGRVSLKKMNFRELTGCLPMHIVGSVDALLVDCGISRLQIVKFNRGFSFDRDADLDMRFDQTASTSAVSLLESVTVQQLKQLLTRFGEKTRASRIARAIVRRREGGRLRTTGDLREAVKTVVKARAAKTLARVFLAIRSSVNNELENLAEALEAFPMVLATGGRACVISYHSGEDRIVKRYFRKASGRCVCPPGQAICNCGSAPLFRILTPKPALPTAEEIRRNPSARSARIRVVEKM